MSFNFKVSEYAKPLYLNPDAFEIDMWGGRGRGGSYNSTKYALFAILTLPYFRGYFMRAVGGQIRDSLWRDFRDRVKEFEEVNNIKLEETILHFNDGEMEVRNTSNGNFIRSKGFKSSRNTLKANLKSLAGATHLFLEEADEVGENEYNTLADSLRKEGVNIQIIRTFNAPPKDHWLMRNYYDLIESEHDGFFRALPKQRDGHLSIFGTYQSNKKNLNRRTLARYERYQTENYRYYCNQILGLVHDGGDKKVYVGWRTESYSDFIKVQGYQCYGLDFGDVAPTALVSVKYNDGAFHRHEIVYESLRSLKIRYGYDDAGTDETIWGKHRGLISHVFNEIGVDRETPIIADPAQKDLIIELRKAGFMVIAAKKDKKSAINFINRARNYITDTSENLQSEYANAYFMEDINGHPIDGKPMPGNDHALDAQEYAIQHIRDTLNLSL